jgi:hypothetical protein
MQKTKIQQIPRLIKDLYKTVDELEKLFPGQKFTPDGHMAGSIGEVLAAYLYNLDLLANSTEKHDAQTKSDKLVQIKATQGTRVSIRSKPDYLIVLKLNRDGSADEIYNGPGAPAWNNAGKMQKNGQRPITLSKLSKLMASIESKDKIFQTRNL